MMPERGAIVLAGLLFAAVALAGLGLLQVFRAGRARRIRARLQRMAQPELAAAYPDILRDGALSSISPLNRLLQRLSLGHRMEKLILQADVRINVSTALFLILTLASAGAFLFLFVFHRPILALPAAGVLGSLPIVVLNRKRSARQLKFERQLPDALDLITGALRSGMAFTGALQLVAEESPDPVAKEFTIIFEEQRLGMDLGESLRKMNARVESREFGLFVTAVLLQKETGGNLAEILEGAAAVIRDRFRILGDIRTITAQARLTGTVLAVLPLVMAAIIWWLHPDYLRVFARDPAGPFLIVVTAVLQVLGYFVIRKIVSIKV